MKLSNSTTGNRTESEPKVNVECVNNICRYSKFQISFVYPLLVSKPIHFQTILRFLKRIFESVSKKTPKIIFLSKSEKHLTLA